MRRKIKATMIFDEKAVCLTVKIMLYIDTAFSVCRMVSGDRSIS